VGGERHTPPLYNPERERVPTIQQAGWALGLVQMGSESLAPHQDSIPGPSSPYPVTIPTTLSQPTKYLMYKFNKKETLLW